MILQAKDISYSHRSFRILNGIDVAIRSGEILAITGSNGAGKSTLLKLLAREMTTSEGIIYFKQKELHQWSIPELAKNKAKFSQENNSDMGLSVKDIVIMGRYPYFHSHPKKQDWEIAEQMMLKTDVSDLKNRGYNTLSGGEKQRVHLARVLAQLQNPIPSKLAFFDEPLNNLDVRHQYQILETIRDFVRMGNSSVLVLHDLNLAAEFADRICLLKKGRVLAQGEPASVFTEQNIENAYQYPCSIFLNPITKKPMILFGRENKFADKEIETKTRNGADKNFWK